MDCFPFVLTFDILHPVSPGKKEAVFQKVYKSLNNGGCLFYKLWFLDSNRTQPGRAALFALKCKLNNQDSHVYTQEEAVEMLQRIGFKVEGILPVGDNAPKILICLK